MAPCFRCGVKFLKVIKKVNRHQTEDYFAIKYQIKVYRRRNTSSQA